MKKSIFIIICLFFALSLIPLNLSKLKVSAYQSEKFSTLSKAFLCMEEDGSILAEYNPDLKLPMASITKVQALNVVFNAINDGDLNLTDYTLVSANAASQEGSTAFLDENSSYSIDDLIKTVVISSANDSMVALAEAVCGTENKFVEKMNELAQDYNLTNTHYTNSTGLSSDNHFSSARDIALTYKHIMNNPLFLKYSNIWIDELLHPSGRKTQLVNTNRLIKTTTDCKAGKTGYTPEAGYCLVASSKRGNMNVISVVLGNSDSKERFNEVRNLLNFGLSNFEKKLLVKKGEILGSINIKNSKTKTVDLVASDSYSVIIPKGDVLNSNLKLKVIENVEAPIKQGDKLATLYVINDNNQIVYEQNIFAEFDIVDLSLKDIIFNLIQNWV